MTFEYRNREHKIQKLPWNRLDTLNGLTKKKKRYDDF